MYLVNVVVRRVKGLGNGSLVLNGIGRAPSGMKKRGRPTFVRIDYLAAAFGMAEVQDAVAEEDSEVEGMDMSQKCQEVGERS